MAQCIVYIGCYRPSPGGNIYGQHNMYLYARVYCCIGSLGKTFNKLQEKKPHDGSGGIPFGGRKTNTVAD